MKRNYWTLVLTNRAQPISFALNQITVSNLDFLEVLQLARNLGCIGIELRNDLDKPLFDGIQATRAGELIKEHELKLLGLSQVYPFNQWSESIADEVKRLLTSAKEAGAEAISLIPHRTNPFYKENKTPCNLLSSMEYVLPMLQDSGIIALIEPLGFLDSSVRWKAEVVNLIELLNAKRWFKLVHDTFHHSLAEESSFFPEYTGVVHVSGVVYNLPLKEMRDEHRVLVDEQDRLRNLEQIRRLLELGYKGPFSLESFSRKIRNNLNPEKVIKRSMEFINSVKK